MKITNYKLQITNKLETHRRGYVALMTVIVLGVVATAVATSLLLLGLGHTRTALIETQSAQARAAADACASEAIGQISRVPSYEGSGNLALLNSTCTYTVIKTGIKSRQVVASGNSKDTTRRVTVEISEIQPSLVFSSWQEN